MLKARTHALVIAVLTPAVLAPGGAPTQATVVERGTYAEAFAFTHDDCGFEVEVAGTATGRFRARAGKGDQDRAFFGLDNYKYSETHTNTETGEFVTITGRAVFGENKATPLGGNLFEFEAVEAGQPARMYDADGNLLARDRGSIHHHVILDVGDDDELGAEVVEFLEPRVHGPHPIFDDYCGLVTAATTP